MRRIRWGTARWRRRFVRGLALALVAYAGRATPAHAQAEPTGAAPPAVVERIIREYMERERVPGVGVGLSIAGKSSVQTFGFRDGDGSPVEADTLFSIGSVTKVFTATLLALEVNAGKLSLDDRVARYLPEMVGRKGRAIRHTTFGELATFTAGFPRDPPKDDHSPEQILRFLTRWYPSSERPIGGWFYSNLSYGVIGYALQHQAGLTLTPETFMEILRSRLLDPLGMSSTRMSIPPDGDAHAAVGHHGARTVYHPWLNAWYAAGSLGSTTKDMLRFLEASMQLPGTPPAIAAAMRFAQEVRVRPPGKEFAQALAWTHRDADGVPIIAKEGGVTGFTGCVAWSPPSRVGVTVLANQGESDACRPATAILERLGRSAPNG